VRWLLQQNIRFHPRCSDRDGLEALRQYHRAYDEDKRVFMLHPDHDWTSHSADAFRYLAISAKQLAGELEARKPKKPASRILVAPPPQPLPASGWASLPTLDQLWKDGTSSPSKERA
jgi:hypothetical protein